MTLSKKNDFKRRFNSFRKHLFFIFQPLVIAIGILSIWYQFYTRGIHFSQEDEVVLTGSVIMILAVAYSITASTVFNSIWEKYQRVVLCVIRMDRETFLCYRDERVPIVIHILILTFTILLITMVGGLEYRHVSAGIASVFSVSFILSLYFIVIVELQNPAKSLWLNERVPKEWLVVDIDEYFKLGRKKK